MSNKKQEFSKNQGVGKIAMNQSGVVLISRNNEVTNCGFVKTILMLLVVFYHSILYWNGQWFIGKPEFASPLFSIIAQWLNTFHIYAFTLVSGYLFYYLKFEKGKYGNFHAQKVGAKICFQEHREIRGQEDLPRMANLFPSPCK